MSTYEEELAQWVKVAHEDGRKPIETTIRALEQARRRLNAATLKNRDEKLRDIGLMFDEATVLFAPKMPLLILQELRPICDRFDQALSTYDIAVGKRRGPLGQRNKVTQQELDALKQNAGTAIDQLIAWFKNLPA